jgi:RNA polymerase sigma factor (sigma-70 family)
MDEPRALAASAGLARVFDEERPALLRFLAARLGDRSEAEDALHDLWLKLGAAQSGPVANPRGYLFRAANNLAIDRARERSRAMRRDRGWLEREGEGAVQAEQPDRTPDAEERLLAEEEGKVLRDAVAALPDGARRALVAFRFEGLGQAEIAARMGISRSGVEKHLALAMKRLREHLADCGYFASAPSSRQEGNGDHGP